jgi:hypothetical protein
MNRLTYLLHFVVAVGSFACDDSPSVGVADGTPVVDRAMGTCSRLVAPLLLGRA